MRKEYDFYFVESIIPMSTNGGTMAEFFSQERYLKKDYISLHEHGHGAFCKFSIGV